MLFEEHPHLGKHDAEESPFESAAKKQRWENGQQNEDQESKDLLEWELQQEKWTEKTNTAILEDPKWQRVGIKAESQSSFSDEERQQQTMTALPSATLQPRGQLFQPGGTRPHNSPGRTLSQSGSAAPIYIEDQRLVQRPASPSMSVRSAHQLGAALSPNSARPASPSSSVRSASAYSRFHKQDPQYVFYPSTPNGGRHTNNWSSAEPASPYRETGAEPFPLENQLPMRVKPYSPVLSPVQPSSQMFPYGAVNRDEPASIDATFREDVAAKSPIASAYRDHQATPQTTPRGSSWIAGDQDQLDIMRNDDADQLEAEFARLESGRGRTAVGFPHVDDERDEHDAMHAVQSPKMGYELEELEKEYERLETRNNEVIHVGDEVLHMEDELLHVGDEIMHVEEKPGQLLEDPDDGVIHLEDQVSLGENEPQVHATEHHELAGGQEDPEGKTTESLSFGAEEQHGNKHEHSGYGIEDLEAEFDEALRRKEVLMRNCSMDSNEGEDDILGEIEEDEPKEDPPKKTAVRKSRWQEKLERFERRGLDPAESTSDVSRYPRLQQIRQRRRERLKALMTIRQERAEIWNTLEANWEHMENSMTRRMGTETKSRGQDPEPASGKHKSSDVRNEPTDASAHEQDDLMADDSLRLSASEEPISNEPEMVAFENAIEAVARAEEEDSPPDAPNDSYDTEIAQASAAMAELSVASPQEAGLSPKTAATMPMSPLSPTESHKSQKSQKTPKTPKSPKSPKSPGSPTSNAYPASPSSLLESIAFGATGKEQKDLMVASLQASNAGESEGKTSQKEDPPPSFGAYVSQSMSDVGTKVVRILSAVRSNEEPQQQPPIHQQGTDTVEEDTSQPTEEARDDDETSNGLGLDLIAGFEEDEDELHEQQGCVNPLQSLIGRPRRIVVEDVAGQGCINPFVTFGFEKATQMCGSQSAKSQNEKRKISGYIEQIPDTYSDIQDDVRQDELPRNQSEDDQKFSERLDGSLSQSDDRDMPPESMENSAVVAAPTPSKKSRRSKKNKHKKSTSAATKDGESNVGVDTFFTLVDDLLVNNILNIMDEKSVDKMAHTFGFD
ncbi:expressed unknown protein [Seminavis robusta]|uniref:Uncharacterized protein n=1 Tax=Seminavis robusta TaxID=568900 RepID=A0A9N8EUQ1_9STRA|nr:expressed unknown protein [Seminavis robusta]|eukprot:Sro1816_g299450.1 n/a (1071) ;mRNA; f:5875-9087